jgi:hypothetical protein
MFFFLACVPSISTLTCLIFLPAQALIDEVSEVFNKLLLRFNYYPVVGCKHSSAIFKLGREDEEQQKDCEFEINFLNSALIIVFTV